MKKTLAVLMAALLAVACFAMVGSAAEISSITQNTEDYPNVTLDTRGKGLTALFDGNKEAAAFTDSVFFKNENATDATLTNTLALVLDLGEETTVGSLTLTFYKEYISMIGLALQNTLTVSSSDDGEVFDEVQEFTFEGEAITLSSDNKVTNQAGIVDYTFNLTTPVTTRYLELKLPIGPVDPAAIEAGAFADNKVMWEFIALTEIVVTEGEPADDTSEPADDTSEPADDTSSDADTSSEAPTTSSEAPATSSAAESSTPSTGDAGMIAIVVLAAAAVIGAAVIVKKRA